MLEWSRLSDHQLADYIDINLTLDQQAERVIEIVEDVILTDEYSYDWESKDSLIYFISLNMTLLDQAKDIYNNNLGSMLKTDEVKALIEETIDEFSLTNMIDDIVFVIAKHLNYDEIINMCLTSSQFVNLCKSRYFWITYLKDVHDIIGVNDLDIDLLKRGVKFIEIEISKGRRIDEYLGRYLVRSRSYVNGFHWIDEDLHIFVKRLIDH